MALLLSVAAAATTTTKLTCRHGIEYFIFIIVFSSYNIP